MSDLDESDVLGQRSIGGPRLWVELRLNRWVFAGAILALAFVALVGASQLGLAPFRQLIRNQNAVEYIFSTIISAVITGTSIVVTINQLVLSQELGAVGSQRERMQAAMEFRRDVEDEIDEDVSPPEPAAFLYELLEGVERQADELAAAVADDDVERRERVMGYTDELAEDARVVRDDLEGAQFGTFDVIWSALNFDYSRKIHRARELRAEYGDGRPEEAEEAFDSVIDRLTFFGPAREHFKTLYFQWELINLSRALLYISVPALVVSAVMLMYVDAGVLPGATFGVDNLVWVTSAGYVLGIAPFVVFISFIVRIATVAKRTLAMGPFILREE